MDYDWPIYTLLTLTDILLIFIDHYIPNTENRNTESIAILLLHFHLTYHILSKYLVFYNILLTVSYIILYIMK